MSQISNPFLFAHNNVWFHMQVLVLVFLAPVLLPVQVLYVERARLEHLDAVVHLQMSPGSLFIGGPSECFDRFSSSCRLPPTDRNDKQAQNHNRQGGYAETHTRKQLLQSSRQSLATCSLHKHPDGTMYTSQGSD